MGLGVNFRGRDTDDHLLTIEEAAERLSVGRTTAYMLVKRGDLKSVRIGKARRVPSSEIDAFIDRLRSGLWPGSR